MSDDLLELYIRQHIEATREETVFFSWHGGEPTLAGIDFYRKAIELQKKNLTAGKKLLNGIQTNGTLLDEEWCRFLSAEKFIAGISLDGPAEIHNRHRQNFAGHPGFEKAIEGYRMLRKFGITTEILCVVSRYNVQSPKELYAWFKSLDAMYLTFLPLVNRDASTDSGVTKESVPALAWGNFLMEIFDEWKENDIGKISVQIFDEAIRTAFGNGHSLCIFRKHCGRVPVIEHNGDFYSCDHFVNPEYLQGNIREKSLDWYLDSPRQKAFGEAKYDTLTGYCRECPVLEYCFGECPKNRFTAAPDGEPGHNYLCGGYRKFFLHVGPFVEAVRQVAGIRNKDNGS
jgi:uncharacterized protein